jgi:hypothetical protein
MIVSSPRQAPPFGSSVLLIQQQWDFHRGYDFRVAANYELQNPDSFFPFQQIKTSFVTESRLLVAQLWGARLQVNLFAVTLQTGNVMLGPLVTNEAFHRPRQFGAPSSFGLYGIGVSTPLGRPHGKERQVYGTVCGELCTGEARELSNQQMCANLSSPRESGSSCLRLLKITLLTFFQNRQTQ